ncbi:carbonic anhydrase [Microlunatus elymi]|uniref:carbonic anhydrase n=1 Tax=Microlunatus elymi TaxID=2596828 RepID=UPI001D186709|nr:carbonic anhydrase [Microlunatus elymi]
MVLGHEGCGAVGAARSVVDDGNLPTGHVGDLVQHVIPSVLSAREAGRLSTDDIEVEHVIRTIDVLLEHSTSIADRVTDGRAAVVGMRYRLAEGVADLVAARGLPLEIRTA